LEIETRSNSVLETMKKAPEGALEIMSPPGARPSGLLDQAVTR
jgi:hypothetical protein